MIIKNKLINFLKQEMDKVNKSSRTIEYTDFKRGFAQGKFDLLMDIDRKFKLGAFIKPPIKE